MAVIVPDPKEWTEFHDPPGMKNGSLQHLVEHYDRRQRKKDFALRDHDPRIVHRGTPRSTSTLPPGLMA